MYRLVLFCVFPLLAVVPEGLNGQAPADSAHWTVVMAGRNAGSYQRWRTADGELRYFFEFEDRGRGPRVEVRLRLDSAGLPTVYDLTGVDYFKAPMFTRFAIADGVARWEGRDDSGSVAVREPAFFSDAAGDASLLVRAAEAHGGTIAMLPEGRVSVQKVGELVVEHDGVRRTIHQYEIAGMGFAPQTVWLTPERELFASGSSWSATVESGWESALPRLFEAQDAREVARYLEMARRHSHRPAGPLVIRDVTIFDAESRAMRPGMTVVVEGTRIARVGAADAVTIPEGAEVVDGRGRTLLPGLWDMHVHASRMDGVLHLAAGVTSARDLGNDTTVVVNLQRQWGTGELLGPRLITSGFIDGPGQFTAPTGRKASTEAEARAAVDDFARLGMEQVKVYSSLDPALLPVIVDQARKHGMRVSGHIPWPLLASQAIQMGVGELQHANFVVLNFLGDSIDTRTPQRFHAPARMAAELDLSSDRVREFVRLLRERDVVVDPTIAVFEGMLTSRPGVVSPDLRAVVNRLPPDVRRGALGGGLPFPEGMDQRYRDSFGRMLEFVALLHREGIRIVPGTDGWAGFTLHRELELYGEAGIPALDVLYIATLGSARVARRDDRLGSIAEGKLADLVLVEGDPASDLGALRRTRLVVKDGVRFDPNALYAELSIGPAP